MQTHFHITNLSCEACVKLSTSALRDIPNVEIVNIDLHTGESFVEASEKIPFDKIKTALEEIGKEVHEISE
jgi:copper chaperone CopZ